MYRLLVSHPSRVCVRAIHVCVSWCVCQRVCACYGPLEAVQSPVLCLVSWDPSGLGPHVKGKNHDPWLLFKARAARAREERLCFKLPGRVNRLRLAEPGSRIFRLPIMPTSVRT